MPALLTVIDEAADAALFRRALAWVRRQGPRASYWRTFWYDLADPPRRVPEELARALRRHLPARPRCAGVEWWVGRMNTARVPLDFHHDRDLALFEKTGRVVHPAWSSVFFCNRVRGGSLFVTDQKLRVRGGTYLPWPRTARTFDSARPAPNRFAIFHGDLLHGVLDARDRVPSRPVHVRGQWRLTIVLNWWPRRPLAVNRAADSGIERDT